MDAEQEKRLFFGLEISCPWPDHYPDGRMIAEGDRHATLAFLGNHPLNKILTLSEEMPKPPFPLGPVGKFDKCLFIPKESHPRVAAWHFILMEKRDEIEKYQKSLQDFLNGKGFDLKGDFLPHVTLARKPFDKKEWKEAFVPLPFFIKALHLYESVGNLRYERRYTHALEDPFEEIAHVADIAYLVKAKTMLQLHLHAKIALAFKFPPLLSYFSENVEDSLDRIVEDLNELVRKADSEIGCAFKAVSYGGEIKEEEGFLTWEMIVDV